MGTVLNLFPARVAFVNADGTLTPEAYRALQTLLARVGGPTGWGMDDVALLTAFVQAPAEVDDVVELFVPAIAPVPDEAIHFDSASADLAGIKSALRDGEATTLFQPVTHIPWDRPGKIGERTANSGAFTTVTATGQVSGDVEFRRTAAAATAGYMLNQLDGTFNGNGIYWSGATSKVQLVVGAGIIGDFSSTGLAITGNLAATNINATPIGQTTPRNGTFSILKSANEFGCNGATARASAALGAAATDLATTQALANNIRTALINNGIGS